MRLYSDSLRGIKDLAGKKRCVVLRAHNFFDGPSRSTVRFLRVNRRSNACWTIITGALRSMIEEAWT